MSKKRSVKRISRDSAILLALAGIGLMGKGCYGFITSEGGSSNPYREDTKVKEYAHVTRTENIIRESAKKVDIFGEVPEDFPSEIKEARQTASALQEKLYASANKYNDEKKELEKMPTVRNYNEFHNKIDKINGALSGIGFALIYGAGRLRSK